MNVQDQLQRIDCESESFTDGSSHSTLTDRPFINTEEAAFNDGKCWLLNFDSG